MIFQSPKHPYTKALVSSVPVPGSRWRRASFLQGEPPNPASRPSGCAFHPRCPHRHRTCAGRRPRHCDPSATAGPPPVTWCRRRRLDSRLGRQIACCDSFSCVCFGPSSPSLPSSPSPSWSADVRGSRAGDARSRCAAGSGRRLPQGLGLDQPLWIQYFAYMKSIFTAISAFPCATGLRRCSWLSIASPRPSS